MMLHVIVHSILEFLGKRSHLEFETAVVCIRVWSVVVPIVGPITYSGFHLFENPICRVEWFFPHAIKDRQCNAYQLLRCVIPYRMGFWNTTEIHCTPARTSLSAQVNHKTAVVSSIPTRDNGILCSKQTHT